jgi:CRISPR-associated protein Cst2
MEQQKHLTIFAIFELMDQNRDEGTGNFQTLKKVKRLDGVYTFISKYSFRHHLFNELKETAGWKEAAVTVTRDQQKVIQFDLSQDDILTSPELDAFGYMFTISGENSITRKAAAGLTDLVSLEPYNGDSAFYANHDLVRRALESGYDASPNPYGKEEHFSFYKGGITINTNRLGVDEWIVNEKPEIEEDFLKIKVSAKDKKIIDKKIQVEHLHLEDFPKNLNWILEKYGKLLEDKEFYKTKDDKENYIIVGRINDSDKYKILFILNPQEKEKRIKDLVETVRGGIKFQVGGRDYALVPLLFIVARMTSPLQVFFPHIGITVEGQYSGKYRVLGLQSALNNPKVEKVYIEYNKDRFVCEYQTDKVMELDKLLKPFKAEEGKPNDGENTSS